MNVALDISPRHYSQRGVSRYINCLAAALRDIPGVQVSEIGFRVDNFGYTQPRRALKTMAREFVWQPLLAPLSASRAGADVVHATCNPCLQAPPRLPKVVTLHDLEMFHTPDRFRWWTRKRFRFDMAAYRKAEHLICVSQATADDAVKFLGCPASRISVTPLGSHFQSDSQEAKPDAEIPDEYFLFVSSLEPGKNLRLLNESYRLAEKTGVVLPPLLIVGERVEGVPHEGAPPQSWIYLGRLSDEELAYVYRRSLALLAPTRYEGFGLPILEAMTLGTAVICSEISSLPEVGGDVPFYADQTPDAYLATMRHVVRERDERDDRIAAGVIRSRLFSWERCARETLAVYESMMKS